MDVYENAMVEARVEFANRINKLVERANAEDLAFFLIYYAALGSTLHESMEKMMKKASVRCKKMKYPELSKAFGAQAKFEALQSQEMKNDAKKWVEWWNHKQALNLSPKQYLRHPMMPSMQTFDNLHGDVVEHQSLFAEVGMAYEIQRTNTIHSFTLIKLALFKLGLSSLRHMGFVLRAAKANTKCPINKSELTTFLKRHPEALPVMVDKATAALSIYGDFLEDCFTLSKNEAKKYQ